MSAALSNAFRLYPLFNTCVDASGSSNGDPVDVNNLGPFSVAELERLSKTMRRSSNSSSINILRPRGTAAKGKPSEKFDRRIEKCLQMARGTLASTGNGNRKAAFGT